MFKKLASKSVYILSALAFVFVLPLLFVHDRNQAKGEVLGAFTENSANTTTEQPEVTPSLSLIGPFVIQPVLNPQDADKYPLIKRLSNPPLDLNAKAVFVFDLQSKTELFSENENKRLPIASLTKMITALVAQEDRDFNKPITITSEDQLQIAPILGLRLGDKVMPKDLVNAMLVGSANDAAWTLANHLPNRDVFVAKMNAKARDLGMINTSFANPVGFDDANNFSTVADLNKLVLEALSKLPYEQIWQKINYNFESLVETSPDAGLGPVMVTVKPTKYFIKNSNDLVFKYSNIKSIKTGQTPGALENMVSEASNAQGNKVVTILLGANDRNAETLKVVNYAFTNFSWQ